jgi:hypothetical protein
MTMSIALSEEAGCGIDRKRANAIAERVARWARLRADAVWSPAHILSREFFTQCAYTYAYEVAFVKAIAKQKALIAGYQYF